MGTPSGLSQDELRQQEEMAARMIAGTVRKAPGGCLRTILASVGVLILAAVALIGFDYSLAPWAWSLGNRPTLTGQWVAAFSLPAGQRGAVYLELNHNPNRDSAGSRIGPYRAPLEGAARSCFSASQIQSYTLSGGANASADDIALGFGALKPTVAGYAFQEMKGAWAGETLTLSGTFTKILDEQNTTLSADEPNQRQPTTIVFHKASLADFEAACRGLGQ